MVNEVVSKWRELRIDALKELSKNLNYLRELRSSLRSSLMRSVKSGDSQSVLAATNLLKEIRETAHDIRKYQCDLLGHQTELSSEKILRDLTGLGAKLCPRCLKIYKNHLKKLDDNK